MEGKAAVAHGPLATFNHGCVLSWSLRLYISNSSASDLELFNAEVVDLLLHAQLKVYFYVGEWGCFVLDQYGVAATPHD